MITSKKSIWKNRWKDMVSELKHTFALTAEKSPRLLSSETFKMYRAVPNLRIKILSI